MSYYPEFAELLNKYLTEKDRTATWLAKRLKMASGTVNRWLNEKTRPGKPETITDIADILGIQSKRQELLVAAGYGYQEAQKSEPEPENAELTPTSTPHAAHIHGTTINFVVHEPSLIKAGQFGASPPFMTPSLPPQGVFGRDDFLKQISQLMKLNQPEMTNVPPVALRGMGGIGKTTLAIALGRLNLIERFFPDGVLWVALGPNPTIRLQQDSWGRALGVDLQPERDEKACRERLQNILHRRRVLLLIDDVWEVNHGKYFTVAGPKCRTLITTRESPIAHTLTTRQQTLSVNVLKPEDALALLRHMAPDAVVADEKNAMRLCERLEFLPLALTLAGRFLANETDVPTRMQRMVDELIERRASRLQLLQAEGRLGINEDDPVSLQAILGMSVERLDKNDQERFAMASVFGGEPLTWDIKAATFVWECSLEEAEDTTSRFIKRGLVAPRTQRYWMHALLADYAADMMDEMEL